MNAELPIREFDTPAMGARVQLHPACDEWMQGDTHGTVTGFSRLRECYERGNPDHYRARMVYVTLDKSGRRRRFHPANILVQS